MLTSRLWERTRIAALLQSSPGPGGAGLSAATELEEVTSHMALCAKLRSMPFVLQSRITDKLSVERGEGYIYDFLH